jgi:hypothetical protein
MVGPSSTTIRTNGHSEKTEDPPIITAWREIPDYLPEIPVKYKIRAGTEDR